MVFVFSDTDIDLLASKSNVGLHTSQETATDIGVGSRSQLTLNESFNVEVNYNPDTTEPSER